jgi:TolB protein
MVVTTPPKPPETQEPNALVIKEACRRRRQRRLRYTAAALLVGAITLAAVVVGSGHGRSAVHGTTAASASGRTRQGNGLIAVLSQDPLSRNTLGVVHADGSGWRRLTGCPRTSGDCYFVWYAWSPHGKRLAFLAGHLGGAVTATNLSLYVIDADGTARRRLAHCGVCADGGDEFSWSPDGNTIAYAAGDGLRVVNVDTGAERRLWSTGVNPAWSPDGSRIAFAAPDALYTIRPDGSDAKRIAFTPYVADPAWSPDSSQIAFDGGDRIHVVDADGSRLRLLLAGSRGSGPGKPAWSPDGTQIAYFSTPRNRTCYTPSVWLIRPDGSSRRQLYHSRGCVGQWSPPTWSPDGKAIALGGDDTQNILIVDTEGHHEHTLSGRGPALAWQPVARAS